MFDKDFLISVTVSRLRLITCSSFRARGVGQRCTASPTRLRIDLTNAEYTAWKDSENPEYGVLRRSYVFSNIELVRDLSGRQLHGLR